MSIIVQNQPGVNPLDSLAFSPDFFKRKFPKYIKKACDIGAKTTVLEIVLADGIVLDVTYFDEIDEKFLLLVAFTDSRTCDQTFMTYVRYETILRVNILNFDPKEREIGFDPGHALSQSED